MNIMAIPKTIRKNVELTILRRTHVLLLKLLIIGIDSTAMPKLQQPAPMVASWLAETDKPAAWKILDE